MTRSSRTRDAASWLSRCPPWTKLLGCSSANATVAIGAATWSTVTVAWLATRCEDCGRLSWYCVRVKKSVPFRKNPPRVVKCGKCGSVAERKIIGAATWDGERLKKKVLG